MSTGSRPVSPENVARNTTRNMKGKKRLRTDSTIGFMVHVFFISFLGEVLQLLVFTNSVQDKNETPIGEVNISRLEEAGKRTHALASESAVAASEVSHLNLVSYFICSR